MGKRKMTFGEKAYSALQSKAASLGRKLSASEIIAVLDEMRPATQKKNPELSDEQWIVSLETEPSLKGINIRQEIGRAQFWCKQNKRVPTRRFLVNWLNKAEKVVDLKAMGAQHATGLKPPPPKGPEGWMQWLETELLSISQDHPAHGQLTAARNCQAFHLLPASWQARCLASHFTETPKQVQKDMALRDA